MRSAIESQKARSYYVEDARVPTPAEVFHMATQGAAEVLGKGDIIASIDPGKEADFTVIDYGALVPYYRKSGRQQKDDISAEDILSLCIYRGGPHATLETFVRGNSVYRADEPDLF
jgi:guanine deaminase